MKNTYVGSKFSHLQVIEETEHRENGYIVCKCVCDCGNIVYVNTKKLKRKNASCGCITQRKKEDISGMVFSHLRVISKQKDKNGKAGWLCECSCGNRKIISEYKLKTGKVKSCGCQQYARKSRKQDLTGKRFGKLVVMYETKKRNYKSSVYWHCRCDCGREVEVTQDNLVYGGYKSCGCLKKEHTSHIYKRLHIIDGTCVEWLENRKSRKDNKSGFRGLYLNKNGKYKVEIGFKKKRFYLGQYDDFYQAKEIRLEAEKILHEGYLKAYKIWSEKVADKNDVPLIFEVDKDKMTFIVKTNIDINDEKSLTQVKTFFYPMAH